MRRIAANFENASLEELLAAEKQATGKRAAYRLLALRLLFQGRPYDDVLATVAIHSRTLARWIGRFNQYGIDGLTHDQERPGRPTKIHPDKHNEFKELLKHPHQVGRDFWTARVVHGYLTEQWKIQIGYSSACRQMHQAGFDLKSPRPWPGLRQDPEKRALFLKDLQVHWIRP